MIINNKIEKMLKNKLPGSKQYPTEFEKGTTKVEKKAMVELEFCYALAQDINQYCAIIDGFWEYFIQQDVGGQIANQKVGGVKLKTYLKEYREKRDELFSRINKLNEKEFNAFAEEVSGLAFGIEYVNKFDRIKNDEIVIVNEGEDSTEIMFPDNARNSLRILKEMTYLVGVKNNYIEIDPMLDLDEQKKSYLENFVNKYEEPEKC